MIQTLEDMIRRFCTYSMDFTDSDGCTNDWCTFIPQFELDYKTSIHLTTGKNPAMLERESKPKLPVDTLKKDLVDINPTASVFKLSLDRLRNHEKKA
ncbi:hypothetical protein O181_071290 [Austropuccinia psidii MF-1]|uniref:Uncharacterized protein n=1 Tax=Austropuccinia psidii MF-1 TaxID=1389203 RepID=A0A9Q3F6F8_9BASI|nr:hypothetical protein [Austropuccinia psidii MF-1]